MDNTIVKIISIEDTRQYEEQGDRFVPIPGSGIENLCNRCGKPHEIHAMVELDNGETAIVGTGCMKKSEMAYERKVKSGINSAKTIQRNKFKLRKIKREYNTFREAVSLVNSTPIPEITRGIGSMRIGFRKGIEYATLECGSESVFIINPHQYPRDHSGNTDCEFSKVELEQAEKRVINKWRETQFNTLFPYFKYKTRFNYQEKIEDLETRIERAEKRLSDIITNPIQGD